MGGQPRTVNLQDGTHNLVLLLCVLVLARVVKGHVEGGEEDGGGESAVLVVDSRLSENALVSRLGTVVQDAVGHVCDRLFDLLNISSDETSVGVGDGLNNLFDLHRGIVARCLLGRDY